MHICLRTRDKEENIYDINTLMYVVLHELSHLCNYDKYGNPIQGHGIEFKNIFRFLVEESIKLDIYTHVDYTINPKEYCGIMISTSIL
jgi:predicted SprT family Zn-dependent metalloprotease